MTVVRLKEGLTPRMKPEHFGTRTDYICGRSGVYAQKGVPLWHFNDDPKWLAYFAKFKPKIWKPSHGLSAVFCAIDRLAITEVALIGFDRILYPDDKRSKKWSSPPTGEHPWPHCQRAEHECLLSLGLSIHDLAKDEWLNSSITTP
jgi:hypothetical protein